VDQLGKFMAQLADIDHDNPAAATPVDSGGHKTTGN
jgi:hypothetical protein